VPFDPSIVARLAVTPCGVENRAFKAIRVESKVVARGHRSRWVERGRRPEPSQLRVTQVSPPEPHCGHLSFADKTQRIRHLSETVKVTGTAGRPLYDWMPSYERMT
jgi:hypothetical protein